MCGGGGDVMPQRADKSEGGWGVRGVGSCCIIWKELVVCSNQVWCVVLVVRLPCSLTRGLASVCIVWFVVGYSSLFLSFFFSSSLGGKTKILETTPGEVCGIGSPQGRLKGRLYTSPTDSPDPTGGGTAEVRQLAPDGIWKYEERQPWFAP